MKLAPLPVPRQGRTEIEAGAYFRLPRVELNEKLAEGQVLSFFPLGGWTSPLWIAREIALAHDDFAGYTDEEIATILRDFFTFAVVRNALFGGRLALEDSPGNVTVTAERHGVAVPAYGLLEPSSEGYEELFRGDRALQTRQTVPADLPDRRNLGHFLDTCKDRSWRWYELYATRRGDFLRFMYSCIENRDEALPVVLSDLETYPALAIQNPELMDFELSLLGLMTRIQTPVDIGDRTAVDAFLEQVETHRAHVAEEGASEDETASNEVSPAS